VPVFEQPQFARAKEPTLVCNQVRTRARQLAAIRPYSAIMRSAHSTRETKMAGLPSFALPLARSFFKTPWAREQAPQENTGMCLATIFSRDSLRGGQPMGITASDAVAKFYSGSEIAFLAVADGDGGNRWKFGAGIGASPMRSCHRNLFRTVLSAASAWLKSRFLPSFHSFVFIS
jgi:hypothetical protein